MRRSLIGAVAIAAAAALTVSGCSSSGGGNKGNSGSGGNVTLKLVVADYGTGPSNTSAKFWQGVIDDFHKANPDISVKVTAINWNDYDSQVQTLLQNKQIPDITEGDYNAKYAQDGLLYPMSDVLSDPGNVLSEFTKLDSYNGTQYGIPWTTSSRTLFYNKKLFSQAGITSPPQTWADIQTDAAKIKKLGKIGFGLPLGSEEAQAEALLWFLGNNGGYQDSSGKWVINSPQNVETLNFMKQLVSAGDTEPNPGTKNRTADSWTNFANGKVGMVNGSPALIPMIQKAGVLQDSDWASVPIAGKNGPLNTTLAVCDNVQAFKANGHQAQIKKFLDFAYQDKYQVQFDKEYDLLPATNSAVKALSSDPTFGPFLKALPNGVQYPGDTVWAQVKSQIQKTIGTAMTGNPAKVLDAIQQTAESGD
ncbi:MAG TPA: extracellular solute-binding protein [Jatrophihabitantaceae bacterium]|nr:extracellular solute-binding protein [Jatrophihabitantaceae bacterium]